MLNQCQFIGNLGADPEVKSFQNGGKICNLRMAVTEKWKAKESGEQKERTEWVSVTLNSDGLVSVAERFLRKGSKIYVSGKMATRKWQDASGNDRYSTEVIVGGFDGKLVMLDGAKSGEQSGGGNSFASGNAQKQTSGFGGGFVDDELDDLSDNVPF
jgi:single-strand DNA-binding protein